MAGGQGGGQEGKARGSRSASAPAEVGLNGPRTVPSVSPVCLGGR